MSATVTGVGEDIPLETTRDPVTTISEIFDAFASPPLDVAAISSEGAAASTGATFGAAADGEAVCAHAALRAKTLAPDAKIAYLILKIPSRYLFGYNDIA